MNQRKRLAKPFLPSPVRWRKSSPVMWLTTETWAFVAASTILRQVLWLTAVLFVRTTALAVL